MTAPQPPRAKFVPDGPARGALLGRALRYSAACFAGYLFGLSAGRLAQDGPGFWVLAVLGVVALWLVFRQGAKSQSHAAADAISAANARAAAVAAAHAQATQVVNVNSGNTFPTNETASMSASLPHKTPQSLEQSRHVDIWSDDYEMPGEQVERRRLHP